MKYVPSRLQHELKVSFKATLYHPKKRFSTIYRFRKDIPDKYYFSLYQELFPFKKSLQDYHGLAFPQKPEQLFRNHTPKRPVSAYRELLWAIARCITYAEQLSGFVKYRDSFEASLLAGSYDDALKSLRTIEDKFGKSIWLYQNLLAASFSSTENIAPVETSKKITEEVKGNPILAALMHYIQRRIEGATLQNQLRSELRGAFASKSIQNYFLAKIVDLFDSSDESISYLLFFDSQSSLIDHYSSLIQALQTAVSDQKIKKDVEAYIIPEIVRLYGITNDRRLIGVLSGLGYPHPDALADSITRQKAIEAYTEGDYDKVLILSNIVLNKVPQDSAIRLLNLKAAVALNRAPEINNGIVGEINSNLFNILSANERFFESAHALLVIADRYFDHNWMQFLRLAVYYEVGSEGEGSHPTWLRDQYVHDIYLSPLIALVLHPDRSFRIIEFLEELNCYPSTLGFINQVLESDNIEFIGLSSRVARYLAREMLVKKKYKDAAHFYLYAAQNEHRSAVKLRVLGGASLAQLHNGQFSTAVETIVQAYLNCPNAPTILPIAEVVGAAPETDRWPNVISLSMLFNLSLQMDEGGDLSKTRLAFEKFCEDNTIDSPTDLAERINEFGKEHVISFLKTVWRPEVMKQTLLYGSAAQIEEARIEVCRVLAQIDPDHSRIYQQELASRVKQQEISKASALVEQSKVYVDIEAIKRSLHSKLKGSYGQYKKSFDQHGKPKDDVIEAFKRVFGEMEESVSLSAVLSQFHELTPSDSNTQADAQFNALFAEITKEFLTGDHGLNAYLSTRVRHGKFVDALRKAVTDQHLVTSRLENGSYAENTYWNEGLPLGIKPKVIQILENFSCQYDDLLGHVRDKIIQIQTLMDFHARDNNEGLFIYRFSNLERRLMQSYDSDFKDLDELVSKCVDILWEKTDINLENVRSYLSDNLRQKINSSFEELLREISNACCDDPPPGMANAIARAGTATQQALDNVINWFRRSEVYDRQDFDIDLPVQIAVSMVRRTMSIPTHWEGPKFHTTSVFKLPGRLLDDLVDIYYALFENAVQYAEQHAVNLKIEGTHDYKNGEFSGQVTSSALSPTEEQLSRLNALKASLSSQESLRLAQSEGRSGFRKILLALNRPIYKSPSLDFEHMVCGKFFVRFSFKATDYQ